MYCQQPKLLSDSAVLVPLYPRHNDYCSIRGWPGSGRLSMDWSVGFRVGVTNNGSSNRGILADLCSNNSKHPLQYQ
eukprot:3430141-Rhodomonas_salina.1